MPEATASLLQIYVFADRFATIWRPFPPIIPAFQGCAAPGGAWGGTPGTFFRDYCVRWCQFRDTGRGLLQDCVEGVGVLAAVGVGAEEGVETGLEEVGGAGGGGGAVEAFERSEIALEGRAGVVPAPVIVFGGPEVALRMGQDGLEAVGQERPDLGGRVDAAKLPRIGDGQFDEDMIALPGQQPAFRADFRPGFGKEPILERGHELQPDPGLDERLLQPFARRDHRRWRIPIQPRAMRRAHRPLEPVRRQLPRQKQGVLHRLRPIVEAGQDMAMAIVCGQSFHRTAKIRN